MNIDLHSGTLLTPPKPRQAHRRAWLWAVVDSIACAALLVAVAMFAVLLRRRAFASRRRSARVASVALEPPQPSAAGIPCEGP